MRHGRHLDEYPTPHPPNLSQAADRPHAAAIHPPLQSSHNASLAPPHDIAPPSHRDSAIPVRPESVRRAATLEHLGPLAVQSSHEADDSTSVPSSPVAANTASPAEATTPAEKPPEPTSASGGQQPPTQPPEHPTPSSPEPDEGKNRPLEIPYKLEYPSQASAITHLEEIYTNRIDELRFVISQRRPYMHAHYEDPEEHIRDKGPFIGEDYLSFFHPAKQEELRCRHVQRLLDASTRVENNPVKHPEAVMPDARITLNETYELIRAISLVHNSRLTIPNVNRVLGHMRIIAQRKLDNLSRQERPPEVAAYMRADVPRFTWDAHSCPSDLVPEAYAPQLQKYWALTHAREANYLIHPDDIAASKTPLHMALKAADAVAADGYNDEAYAIRARVIDTSLQIDHDQYEPEPGVTEFPFMQYIFASAITGELGMSKQAYFDYATAFNTFMGETWDRLVGETEQGITGPATTFIHNYFNRFKHVSVVAPYAARSLLQTSAKTQPDVVATLRALQQVNEAYASRVLTEIEMMPTRPVITNEEARELASDILKLPRTQPEQSLAFDVKLAAATEDADIYGFKTDIVTIGPIKVVVDGDIDVDTGVVYANIEYRMGGGMGTLTLPIQANLLTGEVTVNTVEGTALDATTAELYTTAIQTAIAKHTAMAAEQQAIADAARIKQTGNLQRVSPDVIPVIAPERAIPREKTRGEANYEMAAEAIAIEATNETAPGERIAVDNVTLDSITGYMAEQKLVGINAQRVLERVEAKVRQANQGGAALGKPTGLSDTIRDDHGIKLRQINWIAEGGRQIRLYFEVKPGGRLRLCGIYDKKGDQHQIAYLTKLVKRLNKQSNAASPDKPPKDEPHHKRRSKK